MSIDEILQLFYEEAYEIRIHPNRGVEAYFHDGVKAWSIYKILHEFDERWNIYADEVAKVWKLEVKL